MRRRRHKCVFDDQVNEVAPLFEQADGLVVGTPVYFGSANATIIAFLDRLFYSTGHKNKTMKVGADFPHEEHRAGKTRAWASGQGALPAHELHPLGERGDYRPAGFAPRRLQAQ